MNINQTHTLGQCIRAVALGLLPGILSQVMNLTFVGTLLFFVGVWCLFIGTDLMRFAERAGYSPFEEVSNDNNED